MSSKSYKCITDNAFRFFRDVKNTITLYFLHEQKAAAKQVLMNQWAVGGRLYTVKLASQFRRSNIAYLDSFIVQCY